MAEVIGAKVEIDASSVGNVRKQLKEATADLVAMQQKFGATSNEALEAAKKVATLRDRINDARETADLFDPGNKFKAIGNAVNSLAQGFTAVQGAMGLMGVESKEVEKQLLRVQSAMALSQGLSGIADAGKNFVRLGSIIKTQVVTAFSTLRGAIAATGIGLLISGVALLIENFDAVKKVIYDTFPALKGLFDNFDRIKQIARGVGEVIMKWVAGPAKAIIKLVKGDFKGAVDELKGMFDVAKNFREGEQKEIKAQEAERAAADAERLKKEKEKNDKLAAERKRAADAAAKQRAEEAKRLAAEQKKIEDEADKVLDDARRSRLTERQREEEDAIRKFEDSKAKLRAAGIKNYLPIENQLQAQLLAIKEKYLKLEKDALEKQTQERLKQFDVFVKGADAVAQKLAALAQKNNDNAKYEVETRIALQNQLVATYAEGIGALGTLFDQGTAASKASALAEIAVNAGLGFANGLRIAQQTAAGTGPAAAFAFPIFYAQQVAAVIKAVGSARNILKQVKGGGNGGAISAPSVSRAAPNTPGLSAQTQLQLQNQQAINNMGNQSMRAYVLNSDIRNNNQRNAYLQRNSRIG
jgi:hypothetical protein